jgi:hypothetical protein
VGLVSLFQGRGFFHRREFPPSAAPDPA